MRKKITRRTFCSMLLAFPVAARAQQPKRIPRIGYLASGDPVSETALAEGIRLALRERGYIEGQNIATEYRYAKGKPDRNSELAAEVVRLKVDIIVVAGGSTLVLAAKNATKTIPIVMAGGGADPVAAGLIESLAHPGGNITGLTTVFAGELIGKRLELFKEAMPKLARITVLHDSLSPSYRIALKGVLPASARALRLNLQSREVRKEDDFERVFATINKQRPDGLFVHGGLLISANENRIADFALRTRLPSIYGAGEAVEAGGLMSYGADRAERYQRVAYFVDRILKGTQPADLPVEQPMRFELIVNLKTAKQIGVNVDPNLLARANRIIK